MADKSANIIELNGKQYDARTGRLLHASTPVSTGAIAKRHTPKHTVQKSATVQAVSHTTKKPHAIAPNVAKHKVQRPQTLMRRSVLKPVSQQKPTIKVQSLAKSAPGTLSVIPKLSANTIHVTRAQQALRIQKSAAVSKFSQPKQFKPHAITTAPKLAPAIHKQIGQSGKDAFFEKALATSNSHATQIESKKIRAKTRLKQSLKRQKSVFMVAASVSILVIVGSFIAIANMSNLELKVASMRAGVNANLPSYQPEGYSKNGPVAFSDGKVTISFKANDTSDRNYKIIQQESDWNSQTLFDSVIATSNQPHQSVQQNGNTIYLYGSSQATWVSGGVRYDVTGNANLSTDQLLDIAASI